MGIEDASISQAYLCSFYWVITTMTTVGFGDGEWVYKQATGAGAESVRGHMRGWRERARPLAAAISALFSLTSLSQPL